MADDASKDSDPFSVATIKALIALMGRHDLSEVDLQEGDRRLRLRRGPRKVAAVAAPVAVSAPQSQPAAPAPAVVRSEAPAPSTSSAKLYEVKSETPGTFYAAPDPNSPPYVRVGARVKAGDVLCKIEAMKIFNDVTSDQAGVVKEVCVENAQPVEYGQVLFRIDTSA